MENMDAYFLYGINGEMLLVVRGNDEALMLEIIERIKSSRKHGMKDIGKTLEDNYFERQDNRGDSVTSKPKDKKKGTNR